MTRLPAAATLLLLLFFPAALLAQNSAPPAPAKTTGASAALPPATQPLPAPFLSCSGRFSSLSPPVLDICRNSRVTGQVVTAHLIHAGSFECEVYTYSIGGRRDEVPNGQSLNRCVVNIAFSDPTDTAKMIVGSSVEIEGTVIDAFESHGNYPVNYLIAQNAKIISSDISHVSGAPATTSFMMCQPPQLDALADKLNRELCVQSTLVANLNVTATALEAAARTPLPGPPDDAAAGDPTAITCRADPEHSDAHLTAIACAYNNYWAWWAFKQKHPNE